MAKVRATITITVRARARAQAKVTIMAGAEPAVLAWARLSTE